MSAASHPHTERHYIPAMGRRWMLFLYDPITRLAGLGRVHGELLDRADVQPGHHVLEIGCGPGDLLLSLGRRVPRASLLGIDPDPAALRRARRKAARKHLPIRFERAFADALPVPDGSVDRVLSSYMLHHLDASQKAQAMREVRRVLRPGGQLHLVDLDGTPRKHGKRPHHPLPADQTPEQMLALMRDAGLADAAQNGRGQRSGPLGHYAFYRAGI